MKDFYLAVPSTFFEFLESFLATMARCFLHVAKMQVFSVNSGSLVLFPHP